MRYRDEQLIDPRALAALVDRLTGALDCDLIFEPGRLFVAEAGVLLARVIYLKETEARRFLVLDTGMNNLIRPMLYWARHEILPVCEPGTAELTPGTISNGTSASASASASSPPRPNTNGSPPLSRTTS